MKAVSCLLFALALACTCLKAQPPVAPIPVEFFAGHEALFTQMVVKRNFDAAGKFSFFGLSTYTANYENIISDHRIINISQVSYSLGKGFGLMAGADMNSVAGIAPVLGPQHNFANRQWLAVTVVSLSANEDADLKIFGLYEYKPPINTAWSGYTRFQFIYNRSLQENSHNNSYIFLRAGLRRKALAAGAAANFDWAGPDRLFNDNYGVFVRWEFK